MFKITLKVLRNTKNVNKIIQIMFMVHWDLQKRLWVNYISRVNLDNCKCMTVQL